MHCGGHHDGIGPRRTLHARGNIRCVTEYVGFPATTLSYDHCAGVDANANRKLYSARFAGESIIQ